MPCGIPLFKKSTNSYIRWKDLFDGTKRRILLSFLLVHKLSLSHPHDLGQHLKRFIFRLKSIIFSFWHLWGIRLYLYLFYWNSSEQKVFLLVFEVKKRNYFQLINDMWVDKYIVLLDISFIKVKRIIKAWYNPINNQNFQYS